MTVQWGLGYQRGPNPGEQFQQAYETGTQRRRQEELQSALRGYAMNPNDPNALNSVIQADPAMGMQLRGQQAQQQQQLNERQQESIRLGARIVRQLNVQDEAGWQQARQIAQQAGVDLSQVPATFDPQYVQGLLAAGQALETQQGGQPTEFQRNLEYLERRAPSAAESYLRRQTERPPNIIMINGVPHLLPEAAGAGAAPQEIENPTTGERMRLDPTTNQWVPVQGGPASPAPGTFPPGQR